MFLLLLKGCPIGHDPVFEFRICNLTRRKVKKIIKKKPTRVSNFVLQIQKSIGAATTESDFRKNKPTVASCQGSADDV